MKATYSLGRPLVLFGVGGARVAFVLGGIAAPGMLC